MAPRRWCGLRCGPSGLGPGRRTAWWWTGLVLAGLTPGVAAESLQNQPFPLPGPALKAQGRVDPTIAWLEFCRHRPEECGSDVAEPFLLTLDAGSWRLITTVNTAVNAAVTPLADTIHWGTLDRWDYPDDGFGDCEDFQLLKRRLLTRAGLPRRALRMAVVLDERGEGHAVLMARTDRGDLILDNKTNTVLPWRQTGYVFLKREGDRGHAWVSLIEEEGGSADQDRVPSGSEAPQAGRGLPVHRSSETAP